MPMTLKADIEKTLRDRGTAPAVDLVHLSNQTMGDPELETEVLGVFLAHSRIYVETWKAAREHEGRKRAAHALKGAARGIGAWYLAELAEEAEVPGYGGIEDLDKEVDRVSAYILSLRRD
ncbi:MAG: Hpt domain-containing protein [Rhizobiaceae bacterium]